MEIVYLMIIITLSLMLCGAVSFIVWTCVNNKKKRDRRVIALRQYFESDKTESELLYWLLEDLEIEDEI